MEWFIRTDCVKNRIKNIIQMVQNLVIGKPKEMKAHLGKHFLALLIRLHLLFMDWPVDFDNYRRFPAKEINNEAVNGMLAAEFIPTQLPVTELRP